MHIDDLFNRRTPIVYSMETNTIGTSLYLANTIIFFGLRPSLITPTEDYFIDAKWTSRSNDKTNHLLNEERSLLTKARESKGKKPSIHVHVFP